MSKDKIPSIKLYQANKYTLEVSVPLDEKLSSVANTFRKAIQELHIPGFFSLEQLLKDNFPDDPRVASGFDPEHMTLRNYLEKCSEYGGESILRKKKLSLMYTVEVEVPYLIK